MGGGRRKEDCCGGGGEGFGMMRLDVGFRLSRSALEASLCCLIVLMAQCQDRSVCRKQFAKIRNFIFDRRKEPHYYKTSLTIAPAAQSERLLRIDYYKYIPKSPLKTFAPCKTKS